MIKRYKQFQPILISDFEAVTWEHPIHNHNHYEIIYIRNGYGKHIIKSISVDYRAGDVFLLGPEEYHHFEIEEKTYFMYLKFTDVYIHQANGGFDAIKSLEYLIKSRETHHSGFALSAADRITVNSLFEVISSLREDLMKNEHIIWMQILVLSEILQRNMPEMKITQNRGRDMQAIFCYIHKFIYSPGKLKAEVMASHFNLRYEYLGPYFKRNAGITLRDYIGTYRHKLLSQRFESGQFTLKQLAMEFGLTDESHVSKLLNRRY